VASGEIALLSKAVDEFNMLREAVDRFQLACHPHRVSQPQRAAAKPAAYLK
jgi:hypothetical protein